MFSMNAYDPRCQQFDAMTECAGRLGLAFGAVAERAEDDPARQMQYFELFERCFFAVRMAISLELRFGRPPVRETRADAESPERPELEHPERERREPTDRSLDMAREREREREREPASFPLLLKTLGTVADDAARLPGPAMADLPSLRELLAKLSSDPAPAKQPTPSGPGLRARLATSVAAPILTIPPPARPNPLLALHKATGPPRR